MTLSDDAKRLAAALTDSPDHRAHCRRGTPVTAPAEEPFERVGLQKVLTPATILQDVDATISELRADGWMLTAKTLRTVHGSGPDHVVVVELIGAPTDPAA